MHNYCGAYIHIIKKEMLKSYTYTYKIKCAVKGKKKGFVDRFG